MNREEIHITSLEKIVKEYLEKEGVDYVFQFPTRTGFVIDFVLLREKIAIEVDGKKWHSTEKIRKRNRFKDYQLSKEGWKVLRIKEEEINNLDSLFSSIL